MASYWSHSNVKMKRGESTLLEWGDVEIINKIGFQVRNTKSGFRQLLTLLNCNKHIFPCLYASPTSYATLALQNYMKAYIFKFWRFFYLDCVWAAISSLLTMDLPTHFLTWSVNYFTSRHTFHNVLIFLYLFFTKFVNIFSPSTQYLFLLYCFLNCTSFERSSDFF